MENNVVNIKGLELEYKFLYNRNIKESLDKLFTAPLHGPLLSQVVKLHKAVDLNFTKLRKDYEALVKQYAEVDDKGNLVEPDGPGSFKLKEDKVKDWPQAVTNFMSQKFIIDRMKKIDRNQLLNSGINLTSSDVINLEPVLYSVEDTL